VDLGADINIEISALAYVDCTLASDVRAAARELDPDDAERYQESCSDEDQAAEIQPVPYRSPSGATAL